jgi:hypothetical protein
MQAWREVFFLSRKVGRLPVELRTIFGYPCAFCSGQMFTGIFENRMLILLFET